MLRTIRLSASLTILLLSSAALTSTAETAGTDHDRPIDFTRDVQPILDKCVGCHGGVKKNGGLSILNRRSEEHTPELQSH